eukprot:473577_1
MKYTNPSRVDNNNNIYCNIDNGQSDLPYYIRKQSMNGTYQIEVDAIIHQIRYTSMNQINYSTQILKIKTVCYKSFILFKILALLNGHWKRKQNEINYICIVFIIGYSYV